MGTWWEAFINSKLTGIQCSTCGSSMMPDTTKLRLFFEYLQKKGVIQPAEDRNAHEQTIKELHATQEELLKLKRVLDDVSRASRPMNEKLPEAKK